MRRGTVDAMGCRGGNMSPFFAALVAGGYMACVIVVFGVVPGWLAKSQ
jgi:hypothetical protein